MRQVRIQLPGVLSDEAPVRFGQWLAENGDAVHEGERVAEVLADGVLVYVTAPASGVLQCNDLSPGAEMTVASSLGMIRADDEVSAGD